MTLPEVGVAIGFGGWIGGGAPPKLEALLEQIIARVQHYERFGDVPSLHWAADAVREVLADPGFVVAPTRFRIGALNAAGITFIRRYQAVGDLVDLDAAIDAFERAVTTAPPGDPSRPGRLSNLGGALLNRYQHKGKRSDLDAAIAAHKQATASSAAGDPALPGRLSNLGIALAYRYEHSGRRSDLDEAIQAHDAAVAAAFTGDPDLPRQLSNLAGELFVRYRRDGDLADLTTAIDTFRRAVGMTPPGDPELPGRLSSLGNAIFSRYQLRRQAADLDAAIDAQRRALALTPRESRSWPVWLGNLGNGLLARYHSTKDTAALSAAVDAFQQACDELPADHPDRLRWLGNLGSSLLARYEHTGAPADLDAAIRAHRSAVDAAPPGHPERPGLVGILGNSLRRRYERNGDAADLEAATDAYRTACAQGLQGNLAAALAAADTWSGWATQRRAWAEGIEACELGLTATEQLVRTQLVRGFKEVWLRQAQTLPRRAAWALAARGDARTAAVALERGRAVLLVEALERERVDLDRLETLGRGELARRYREATEELRAVERPAEQPPAAPQRPSPARPPTWWLEKQRQARADLNAVITQIQQVAGYHEFLRPPTLDTLLRSAADAGALLVYLVAAEPGGIALTVGPDARVAITELPRLREPHLREQAEAYFEAYRRRAGRPGGQRLRWAIDKLTEWLWDSVMAPLIPELLNTPRLVLIPTGLLGVLPLHAARVADPTTPTGWRYALDHLPVTFTPNARALREALRTAGRVDPEADSILAVDEPLPVGAGRLPNSTSEVRAAAGTFRTAQLLRHQQATRAAVLAALGSHQVVHFSCHGYVELRRPRDSALVMANDEALTLWDLMGRRLVGTRLAVLSACETALPGAELLDEVISLPTGLLQAGAAGVIGSLWSVSEPSTMLLLSRFYHIWRNEGVEPSEALRQAQRWIRDRTGAELAAAFPSIPALAEPRLADQRPFAHPYYWAAFTYTGT